MFKPAYDEEVEVGNVGTVQGVVEGKLLSCPLEESPLDSPLHLEFVTEDDDASGDDDTIVPDSVLSILEGGLQTYTINWMSVIHHFGPYKTLVLSSFN